MPKDIDLEISRFPEGKVIAGRYEIVEHLGQGAAGFVVKARDTALDNDEIALKILYPSNALDSTSFARFRQEVIIARRLSHPNIVRLYDFGDAGDGYFFISMEFVHGMSLRDKLDAGPLDLKMCTDVICGVAKALAHAHEKSVVHRDIKPHNILMSQDGEVKLTDFGVARLLDNDMGLTKTGEGIGTPLYMAPEQLNAKTIDHRSDIYSLGIVAYEVACGEVPFEGQNWMSIAAMHLSDPMPPVLAKRGEFPTWYEQLVFFATEKDKNERFQSMEELIEFIAEQEKENSNAPVSLPLVAVIGTLLLFLLAATAYFVF